jgi:pyrimidine-nucleoside phosphorylase
MDEGWLRRALAAKRDGGRIDDVTWSRIIAGYTAGEIDDAPIAALAMACAIRGLDDDETAALTRAMIDSGDTLAFPGARGVVVDKHSSGGVGDTVSLIVVPLVAACGVPVAKLSGRALGHTGGTLDKLESIAGVRTDLSPAAFVAQVESIGCAIGAQSERLVPADKKLYALRDRTGTVVSPGLIAASIVSKKIAGGAAAIVYDVKAGRGAFMPTVAAATELAHLLVRLSARFGRRASAFVSDMEEPLGAAVGTGVEAVEARDFLRGDERDPRLAEASIAIAREMLLVAGVSSDGLTARVLDALESGAAYERFGAMVEAQGGSRSALDSIAVHAQRTTATASSDGYITAIDTVGIGEYARALVSADGPFAGIRVLGRIGAPVRAGAALADIAGSSLDPAAVARLFTIGPDAPRTRPIVDAIVRDADEASAMNTELVEAGTRLRGGAV